MSKPVLLFLYFCVATPVGLWFRFVRDPLNRSWRPTQQSYWIPASTAASYAP